MQNEPISKPTWTITRIEDVQDFQPGAGNMRKKRVYFRTLDGTQSYVDIPMSDFNAEATKTAVDEAAANILEVRNLEGDHVMMGGQ